MASWVKEVRGGYKDSSQEEGTHVVMDYNEFIAMRDDIRRLKKFKNESIDKLKALREENAAMKEDLENHEKMGGDVSDRLERADRKVEEALFLNRNLKRVMTERANADRKLKPKKQHSGYRPLSQQGTVHLFDKESQKRWCYKATMETPYDAFMERKAIITLIKADMDKICEITNIQEFFPECEYSFHVENRFKESCVYVMDYDIRANYRSGYYEIDLFCTKEVKFMEK